MKYLLTVMLLSALPFSLLAHDNGTFHFFDSALNTIFFIAFSTAIYVSLKRQK